MSNSWSLLAAALVSGSFVLAGVWVTTGREHRRQRELLQEEALKSQREIVANLSVVAQEWASMQMLMVPLMSRLHAGDLAEFADTESGRRVGSLTAELRVALTRTRLFLGDADLLQIATTMSTFVADFPEKVNGPIFSDPGNSTRVGEGIGQVARFQNTVRQLEDLAVERLRSQV